MLLIPSNTRDWELKSNFHSIERCKKRLGEEEVVKTRL
jgi:hypothetical protein